MRFSLRLNNDLSINELGSLVAVAEDAGFDQLWISNDLMLRSAPVLVGNLAAHTTRLKLGIGVMNPYSMHVSEVAMAAATLQEVTDGRFLLGLGAGAAEFLDWVGLRRDKPLGTTEMAVNTLRAWLGHEVAVESLPDWFDQRSVLRFDLPEPVPVYIGGMGPKMLALAGRVADGALPLLYPPEHYSVARRQILESLERAGRRLGDFDLPACFWVSVSGDPTSARRALAEKLAYYGSSISPILLKHAGLSPQDFEPAGQLVQNGDLEGAVKLIDEAMLKLGIAGGASEVVERCRHLIGAGATHLSFGPPLGPDPVAAVALLAEHVLPLLRSIIADASGDE